MANHTFTDPGIQANETGRLRLLDVNCFVPIENRQVAGEAGHFRQFFHQGLCDSSQVEQIACRIPFPKTQHLIAKPILLGVFVALGIAALTHGLQKIERRTIRNFMLFANLLHSQAEAGLVEAVENGKGTLQSRNLILFTGWRWDGGHGGKMIWQIVLLILTLTTSQ